MSKRLQETVEVEEDEADRVPGRWKRIQETVEVGEIVRIVLEVNSSY